MSNEKITNDAAANDPVTPAVRGNGQVAASRKPAKDVKVESFEIADDDSGSDPYNRTGSFCVPDFDDTP